MIHRSQRIWAAAGGFREHDMSPVSVMVALLCLPVAERCNPLLALENFFSSRHWDLL